MEGILGKKIGMTQVFTEDGTVVPVTVVKAGPCVVVQRKTTETDGYDAVQLGLVEPIPPRRVSKPRRGQFAKAGVTPTRRVAEFGVDEGDEEIELGAEVKASIFEADEFVDVVGTSKGKGFSRLIEAENLDRGRYKRILMHIIQAEEELAALTASSKVNAEWSFLAHLRDIGRDAAGAWLDKNFSNIGRRSSVDLTEFFASTRVPGEV